QKSIVPARLVDEMAQHKRCGFEVRDYPVSHWFDGGDLLRSATEHLSGGDTYRLYTAGSFTHCDDGGFVHHDTLVTLEHEGVGGAEVDCQIRRKPAEERQRIHIWCR